MERFLMRDLEAWRENPCRKPLIINGARQVGKTWLIKEFGRRHYKHLRCKKRKRGAIQGL